MRLVVVAALLLVCGVAEAAWFVAPYKECPGEPSCRYCAMNDFTTRLNAVGGTWSESECLGNHAVVKVTAPDSLLTAINAAPGFIRIPVAFLHQPLSSLTAAQKAAIKAKAQSLGYTLAEFNARFPDGLGAYTLRDLMVFILSRRREPRWDEQTQAIVFDGPNRECKPIDLVDQDVPDTLRYVGRP